MPASCSLAAQARRRRQREQVSHMAQQLRRDDATVRLAQPLLDLVEQRFERLARFGALELEHRQRAGQRRELRARRESKIKKRKKRKENLKIKKLK